jgi:DNA-binding IclR family transcriptional regulator
LSTTKAESRATGVQVIARAAEILRALEGEPEGLSLGEIAARLGLPRSTVHRIVSALEAERLVSSGVQRGRVRLGPGLYRLAATALKSLSQTLHPHLVKLSRSLDETVDLAILEKDRVLFVDQVLVSHRLQAVSAVGTYFPLHCTANGKALLAELPLEEVERLLPERLKALTPYTLTERAALIRELETVRKTGVAFDREEHTLGICSVGVAVRDVFGRLAAITVPVPAPRFAGQEARITEALLKLRDEIEGERGERSRG